MVKKLSVADEIMLVCDKSVERFVEYVNVFGLLGLDDKVWQYLMKAENIKKVGAYLGQLPQRLSVEEEERLIGYLWYYERMGVLRHYFEKHPLRKSSQMILRDPKLRRRYERCHGRCAENAVYRPVMLFYILSHRPASLTDK